MKYHTYAVKNKPIKTIKRAAYGILLFRREMNSSKHLAVPMIYAAMPCNRLAVLFSLSIDTIKPTTTR